MDPSKQQEVEQAAPASEGRPRAAQKYSVTVATTGPPSEPVEANGNHPIRPVVEQAFEQLGITTSPEDFTYKAQDGSEITLKTKVEDACSKLDCRIIAVPTKAQDA